MAELDNRPEFERKLGDCLVDAFSGREEILAEELGDPPQISNIDSSFWTSYSEDLNQCLDEIMLAMFSASVIQTLIDNILIVFSKRQAENHAQRLSQAWVPAEKLKLTQTLTNSSQRMLARRAIKWAKMVSAGGSVSKADVAAATKQLFGGSRIKAIKITTTTNVIATAAEMIMQEFGLAHPRDVWINHPELSASGPCLICRPLHKTTRAVWSNKFPFGPPVHVYCVCEIRYFNSTKRQKEVQPNLDSVFVGSPDGGDDQPIDRGTRSTIGI